MQKHKVLIPLDGSAFSRQIFRAVREWFDPQTVTLVLLRVDGTPTLLPETALPHRFVSDTRIFNDFKGEPIIVIGFCQFTVTLMLKLNWIDILSVLLRLLGWIDGRLDKGWLVIIIVIH